mmetsp:Transcript_12252/g.49366  ORF Transcript_12252/g.49366 Transcript_12252/m.49366 type:complete len:140 (-) Transcript_12252:262-681(-)
MASRAALLAMLVGVSSLVAGASALRFSGTTTTTESVVSRHAAHDAKKTPPPQHANLATVAAGATAALAPVVAFAAELDPNYEYGAVAAPGWVLPVGALAVISTALLPLALKAGDDAQKEMAVRDADTFGKRGKSPLDKK